MNKKQKLQLAILIILMALLLGFLIFKTTVFIKDYINQKKKSEEIVEEFNELYEKGDLQVILFASKYCAFCKKFIPVLDEIKNEYGIDYYQLDITEVFKDELKSIFDKLGVESKGVPYLVVLQDKKVIKDQRGAQTKEFMIEFFKELDLIKGENENE